MKKIILLFSLLPVMAEAEQLAFPGAAGWGRFATGGRGGAVYHVTNLNDSGTGSLRDAVSQSGRIIIFDVSGVINLNSRLACSGDITIAGQTAPGEGIEVYGDAVSFSNASNTIVRYMRFRMGKSGTSGKDAVGIANGRNMIFDHCSVSWGLDENFSINWDNKNLSPQNITIQNTIIAQGLLTHSAGGLIQADSITLYRNFYVDNSTRNNKVKGISQYVNNIVYNWGSGCYLMGGDSEGESYVNVTDNLFVNGPSGTGNAITSGNSDFHIYADDNWQDKNRNGLLDGYEIPESEYGGGPTFASEPYGYPSLETYNATELIDKNIPTVGAYLPYRDMADFYVVHELKSLGAEGATLSNEGQLPFGAPSTWTMTSFDKPTDSDGDGMPDAWETANGTDPNVDDAMTIADNGYANIENYINSISKDNITPWLRSPQLLTAESATDSTVTLTWSDYTENETAFVLERLENDVYNVIANIDADTETYTVRGLDADNTYYFRLKAVGDGVESDYTGITAKTQPEQVDMVDIDNFSADYEWNTTGTYSDEGNILIDPADDATITLSGDLTEKDVVVRSDADVVITGGSITGEGSLNKAGEGSLTLSTLNSYTGATVGHAGQINFSTLKNGGEASSIGASSEFAQNWIWNGATWNYTGESTTTNRPATIYQNSTLNIENDVKITTSGALVGEGALTLDGNGTLAPASPDFFQYTGNTILRGGTLYLDYLNTLSATIGKKSVYLGNGLANNSPLLVLAGGTFQTVDDKDNYSTYFFPMYAEAGTTSTVNLFRNNYIRSKLYGYGNVNWIVTWVREYIQGDWQEFYGTLIANGTNTTTDGSQLMFNQSNGDKPDKHGIPNGILYLKGNTKVIAWETNGTLYFGGVSGDAGTYLGGSSKKTKGFTMNYYVGAANTDETFAGVINNEASSKSYTGTVNITKEGSGIWRLTGKNIYAGTTNINDGRLFVNGTHSGGGAYTVNDGAVLGGTGTINSSVNVTAGGTIAPGDTVSSMNNFQTLTCSGGVVINSGAVEYTLTKNGNAKLKVDGALTLTNATLRLNTENLTSDDINEDKTFQLFSSTTFSGTFENIEPAVPAEDYEWDDSELYSNGILKISTTKSTVIASPKHDNVDKTDKYYDLTGRRSSNTHGVSIINGKKTVTGRKTEKKINFF